MLYTVFVGEKGREKRKRKKREEKEEDKTEEGKNKKERERERARKRKKRELREKREIKHPHTTQHTTPPPRNTTPSCTHTTHHTPQHLGQPTMILQMTFSIKSVTTVMSVFFLRPYCIRIILICNVCNLMQAYGFRFNFIFVTVIILSKMV